MEDAAGRTAARIAADDQALAELRWHWGDAYDIGLDGDNSWQARRRDGLGGLLTAAIPDDLYGVISADYGAKTVPRSVTPADGS